MAYVKTDWKAGDLITSEKLNNLENGVAAEQVGPAGKDGVNITGLELTTDSGGKVTGGTATLSDGKTIAVTVKAAGA
ncbi:MAG: phosphoenolpyruvate synthase [Schleiferilactobacillus perolens]|uniref:phosphoenolpyruvate synthase n=1 Tax=Schleiferilactobacillus perolens TaxID=100468 RepID=UPI0039E9945E